MKVTEKQLAEYKRSNQKYKVKLLTKWGFSSPEEFFEAVESASKENTKITKWKGFTNFIKYILKK